MKLNTIVPAGLFSVIAALSIGAQAAADTDKGAEAKAQVASVKAEKKMKPHSHMEEKTGVPQQKPLPATEGKSGNLKADKDKGKHFHPRDGKS